MKFSQLIIILSSIVFSASCHKKEHLETKPSSNILIPTSSDDLQGLLDNPSIFGLGSYLNTISADEFYYTNVFVDRLSSEGKAYTWQEKIFDEKEKVPDWENAYAQVFYCNMALEGVEKELNNNGSEKQLNPVKGDALFKRSIAFFNLAQIFAPPYDPGTASSDLGIPLRLTTDSKEVLSRGSVQATYARIISDLNKAIPLLSSTINPKFRNRASQQASWAMLARVYLSMRDYQNAAVSAENCLNLYDSLIDFNDINLSNPYPFTSTNKETLYQSKMPLGNFVPAMLTGSAYIDVHLASLYAPGDLRQFIFFNKSTPIIKGSFSGDIYPFNGLALDEVYLILAEAYTKNGQVDRGLKILNKLLVTRWAQGQFIPYTDSDADKARLNILTERQKELMFRGQRWSDIRRLNKEGFKIDLTRNIGGTLHTLAHSDYKRFVLPLPENVIKYGYPQNLR